MVQLSSYGKLRSEAELPIKKPLLSPPVKLEIEDQLDDKHGPLNKRSKLTHPPLQQWGTCESTPVTETNQYNLLTEPSPLGLRLRKSPSLLDLIQMRLSQVNATVNACRRDTESSEEEKKKDTKPSGAFANNEKMKASNFPASLLRIGTWEYASRYEGDLVAKCYFAKRKLVWEILEGGLKSKIEIQWSDIAALKATCPEDGPGTLDIVLSRQPIFFRETNPQPRKHTLWQATSDFTNGQASIHRRHFLQCPQGLLSKHLEKLFQFDPRLCALSQEPDFVLESPFFEQKCSVFEDQEFKCHPFDKLKNTYESVIQEYQDAPLTCATKSTCVKSDIKNSAGAFSDTSVRDIHPSSSVMEPPVTIINGINNSVEKKNQSSWDQLKVPGLKPSMSISDFVNQLEHCISGQISSGNSQLSGASRPDKDMLEELVQSLFSDSQMPSDEKSILSKVNSFCCLLQKDAGTVVQSQQINGASTSIDYSGLYHNKTQEQYAPATEGQFDRAAASIIPRKDSFGELLMQLPRIASLPQFLFNIAEVEEDAFPSS
ncbi:hypothetical protein Cni_G08690 [Canna indica]|uniref:TRF2/HOY1 PH-like domain-containing protein n=1 Tax=Canna indica TaxID=4628 RepID=A0AAQ3K119_9LILI|nr:hypothetical protein Cni_G08690 [Canna indica]